MEISGVSICVNYVRCGWLTWNLEYWWNWLQFERNSEVHWNHEPAGNISVWPFLGAKCPIVSDISHQVYQLASNWTICQAQYSVSSYKLHREMVPFDTICVTPGLTNCPRALQDYPILALQKSHWLPLVHYVQLYPIMPSPKISKIPISSRYSYIPLISTSPHQNCHENSYSITGWWYTHPSEKHDMVSWDSHSQ